MLALRTGLRQAIAFLGMAAVLMGAFEHEDLIFQDATPRADAVSSTLQIALNTSCQELIESGTEGTFRSEKHHYWLSPKAHGHFPRQCPSLSASFKAVPIVARCALHLQARPVGLVALRL